MNSAELEQVAEATRRVLDERGFICVDRPPIAMTEDAAERMVRRFYEVAEHLGLQVEKQPGFALVAYRPDTPDAELDAIRRSVTASMN